MKVAMVYGMGLWVLEGEMNTEEELLAAFCRVRGVDPDWWVKYELKTLELAGPLSDTLPADVERCYHVTDGYRTVLDTIGEERYENLFQNCKPVTDEPWYKESVNL